MYRSVIPYSVTPGKTATAAGRIAAELQAHPREYVESRRRLAIALERTYLQETQAGAFVVSYVESNRSLAETLPMLARSALDIDRYFVNAVRELHGVDLTAPLASHPETVAAWFDPATAGRGKGLAFCAPLWPEAFDRARSDLSAAYASREFAASRRALGENGEVAVLLRTPRGPIGAVYLEGVDPYAAARRLAASDQPYERELNARLRTIVAASVDVGRLVAGVEEIFDSVEIAALLGGAERKVA